jgi:hypothetical protein
VNITAPLYAAGFACALGLAFGFHTYIAESFVAPTTPSNQGCVNQGSDRRIAAPVVCWAQRHLSRIVDEVGRPGETDARALGASD